MNYQKSGTAFTVLPASNPIVEIILDQWAWLLLKWYYMPFEIIGRGDEVDQWIKQFTLNGIKSGNLCRP
jgi:hypothetical protein